MQTFIIGLPLIAMAIYTLFGYRFLKIKGYTGLWYISLIFASTPLFWFIWGSVNSRNPTERTKTESHRAIFIGLTTLFIIMLGKNIQQGTDVGYRPVNAIVYLTVFFTLGHVINIFLKSKNWSNWLDYKIYLIMLFLILVGFYAGQLAHQKKTGWDKEEESTFLLVIEKRCEEMGLTKSQTDMYKGCVLEEFKKKYPNGMSGVSESDSYILGKEAGKKCMPDDAKIKLAWNTETENIIRVYLNNIEDLKYFTASSKSKFVDCVIDKLKATYPDGMDMDKDKSPKIIERLSSECAGLLDKK